MRFRSTPRFSQSAKTFGFCLATGTLAALASLTASADLPAGFEPALLDAPAVTAVRDGLHAGQGTPEQQAALDTLTQKADDALLVPIRSVTDKKDPAPSGSKNDYVSLSPYWWPNPDTADGRPYVRHDGKFNPERDNYDVAKLGDLGDAVRWLAFAYYFTGNEDYARNAIERCRVWFVDPATRMTPRMQFAQFVPGVNDDGRHVGIIETVRLRWMPDAFAMLEASPHMTGEIRDGVRQWFADYADWLTHSEFGIAEHTYANNHGTWAHAQIASYGYFGDRKDLAERSIATIPARIDEQIAPDGSQPHELERTMSLHYSDFNLRAMMDLATIADRLNIDLWSYQSEDGRSIRRAVEFLVPYLSEQAEWPYEQIRDPKAVMHAQAMRTAALAYDEPAFEATIPVMAKWPGMTDEGAIWTELILPVVHETAESP